MAEEFAKSLERYDVVDRIAVGGMAEVFLAKAYGAHGFEKTLAIKRILPDLASDPEFEQRFIAEAKVAVKLSHTNIVQVMDFGRFANSLFIAMEYVDGLDLAALLRRYKELGARVPVPAAFQIAIELSRGLDYAHSHGVVHRDVSPSNILLSRAGEVKIADFGIAVAARPNKAIAMGTGARKVMGKWRYMSPEQARGENLDTRSDLFSAASVMFELFTGEKLFPGEEAEDIVKNINEMSLPRPSKVRDGLPARLDEILHAALARRPSDRPARAAVMLRALTELSYESSIVCTTLDVAEAVAAVLPSDQTAASVVDEMIRKQLIGGSEIARETAVTDGKRRETAITGAKIADGAGVRPAGVDTTGVFRHKIDLDGVSRLEVADSTTLAAQPRARRQTGEPAPLEPVPSGASPALTGLAAAVAELGVTVPFDPDRRTEVGPPLLESRPFFKVEPEEKDKTAAREKISEFEAARGTGAKAAPTDPTIGRPATQRPEATPTGEAVVRPAPSRRAWIALAVLAVGGIGVTAYTLSRGGGTPAVPIAVKAVDAAPAKPQATGTLVLSSDPPGASVLIDNDPRGTTPTQVTVTADQLVTVRMELAGRKTFEDRVTVGAGKTREVGGTLVILPARLKVTSKPDGATVRLGGIDLGRTTLDRDGLDAGKGVVLEVSKTGFQPVKEKIDLEAGVLTERSYTLVEAPRFGKVQITAGAGTGVVDVLDEKGKVVGEAGFAAGVFSLPVGPHRLKLRDKATRAIRATMDVNVIENKTTAVTRPPLK